MRKEKIISLVALIAFIVFLLIFYDAAALTHKFIFHQPTAEVETILKYNASRFLDMLDLNIFWFNPPAEYEAAARRLMGDQQTMIRARFYHLIINDVAPSSLFYRLAPWWIILSFFGAVALFNYLIGRYADYTPEAKRGDVFVSGRKKVSARELIATIQSRMKERQKDGDEPAAAIETEAGSLLFSGNLLRKHSFIFGASGQGKSQYLLAFFSSFRRHNPHCRIVCVDVKGEFIEYFYRPDKDLIFHPFDARGVRWSIFNEVNIRPDMETMPADVDALGAILFPAPTGNADPFWRSAGAMVFSSAMCYCIRTGKTTNQDLINFCTQPLEKIREALQELPEAQAVGLPELANEMTGSSVIATMLPLIKGLAACQDGDFSVREWIRNGAGNLYLSAAGMNGGKITSIISLWLDLIGRELKEFPDSGGGGTKFLLLVDELSAYKRLEMLHFFITEARSKGVAVLLANQSLIKVEEIYGVQEKENLITNTGTKVIFRMGGSKDAEEAAKLCGDAEIQRESISENENASVAFGKLDGREGKTRTKQIVKEEVYVKGEIMTLEAGEAVVIHPLAGNEIAKVQFKMYHGEKHNPAFEAIQEDSMKARDFAEAEKRKQEQQREEQEAAELEKQKQDEREMIERVCNQPTAPETPPEQKPEEKPQEWDIDF